MERIDKLAEQNNCTKIEYAKRYFKEQGCILLAEEWPGALVPMSYECKCGEVGSGSWNNFTKGKRCGKCCKYGGHKKWNLDRVKQVFADRGCEFLDNTFVNGHHKHNYRCKCGNETQISFAAFHYQQQYCRECGIEKNKGAGNHQFKPDREGHQLDQLFRKKCYKALATTLKRTEQRKTRRTHELLGYTHQELREHVERDSRWPELKDGPWHLDHIFPIQAFLDRGIRDIKLINCLENLQPLPGDENIAKSDSYDETEFEAWLIYQDGPFK